MFIKLIKWIVLIFVLLFMLSWSLPLISIKYFPSIFEESYSDDGKYKLVYYSIPIVPFDIERMAAITIYVALGLNSVNQLFNNQCMGCPGVIRLVNIKKNKVIAEYYFQNYSGLGSVSWWKHEVSIRGTTSFYYDDE